jgi:group I intron endonuclease
VLGMGVFIMLAGIYKFSNKVNGKIYIGQTHSITSRLRTHLKAKEKCPLYDDIILYGWKSFKFEVIEFIEHCDSINDVLNEREQYYIDIHIQMGLNFNTMFYNDILFIDHPSYLVTEDQKANMKKARDGMRLSTEHILSMSIEAKGRNSSEHLKKHRPSGANISKGLRRNIKHVLQYDLDGGFIKEHETQMGAAAHIGMEGHEWNINKALKGIMHQAYGFQWRYYTKDFPIKIDSVLRKVRVLDYYKNQLAIYNSPIDAANALGLHVNRVIYALNNSKYNYSRGYYFHYLNDQPL